MKRFYEEVTIAGGDQGFRVLLDGRPLRTPAKRSLVTPTADLADAIANEWQAQTETIRPAEMRLTRLASTALDRMPEQRAVAIETLIEYAGTDLLCYRAAEPVELVHRQEQAWQPLLDWLAEAYEAALVITTSVMPVAQPDPAMARLRAELEGLYDWPLVGLHSATTALGSLVLGLALLHGRLDAEQAMTASLLDELFEIERWGSEPALERRHHALRCDVEAAATFLSRLPPPSASTAPGAATSA